MTWRYWILLSCGLLLSSASYADYTIDYGDGTTESIIATPWTGGNFPAASSHNYTSNGIYQVTLTSEVDCDADGLADTTPLTSSLLVNVGGVKQAFDFGDGTTQQTSTLSPCSTPLTPDHQYSIPGTYQAIYRAFDDSGNLITDTIQIVVAGIDHYRIEHTGVGLTCQRSTVTIRACTDAACATEYTGTVTLDLLPATSNPTAWIGGASRTFSGGTGTFQLRQTTPATLALGLTNISPSPTNGTVCYLGGSPGNCDITFYESGFLFDVPALTSCQSSSVTLIQAVRADATAQTCVVDGGFSNVSKTIGFWSSYVNPVSGSESVTVSGTTVGTASPGTGIVLNFDSSAISSFSVNYPDAGQMQLDTRYDGSGEEAGLVMLGSDSFAVRPVGLCVYSDDINTACASADGSCSVFKKVDEVFNLKVKGVCWESDTDTDFCSGNITTPNFALSNIPLIQTLVAPSGASGTIGVSNLDISAIDNGEHVINNQTVSEVGVFTFTAMPPNYLGGVLPAATSANIGRFTPDHFLTAITSHGLLLDACTGFTYSGQNFGYDPLDLPIMTITAVDSGGATTRNYRDDFVKLTSPATQISMPAVTADSSNLGADLATPLALTWTPLVGSLVNYNNGGLSYTLGADTFSYTRDANALVTPFASDIQLFVTSIADTDGIVAADLPRSFAPGGIEIRYGQLDLQNAYGPEILPLTLTLATEYYNGTSFVANGLDSCTAYDVVNLSLSNYQGNLDSGETTPAGIGRLAAGIGAGLSLSASGVGNEGSVDLSFDLSQATGAAMEWLQPGGVNPSGKATFGIFKGNDRLIYMRESVQ